VRGRRPDGFHDIETLFAFAGEGDVLSAEPADDLSLTLDGPFAAALSSGEDNLVIRAARALAARSGRGAAIRLDKRLPPASGIGGGSADAAAALRLLDRFWGLDADLPALEAIAASLGSDVPACVSSRAMRGTGRGEQLVPAEYPGLLGTPLLLVNPGTPLPTAVVFAGWDGEDSGPLPVDWRVGRNDLEGSAIALCPAIAVLLDALREAKGARHVRMSGSGATCFALFDGDRDRDAASAAIRARFPAWWQLPTRLRRPERRAP